MKNISIIDYGLNNLKSVLNACLKFNVDANITSLKKDIKDSDILILPGVGSFPEAINNLKKKDLFESILEHLNNKHKFFIGICLGMQMLFDHSEEFGNEEGFKIFRGKIKKFKSNKFKKIPHVGWRNTKIIKKSLLTKNFNNDDSFYFVHSFYAEINRYNNQYITSTAEYYGEKFISSIKKNNIYGFQFHPEKSGNSGMKFYRNLFKLIKNV